LTVDIPVPPRAGGKVPAVIAEALMAMLLVAAEVICPCAFTARTGTDDAVPYVDAVTAVLVILNCVPVRVRPVPAV
jgi:hypothetical protein